MFEKFKEDIREYHEDYIDEDNLWCSRNDKFEVIKQSYLNAIDCINQNILNQDTGLFGGSLDKTSAIFGSNKRAEWTITYLQEQRNLIENYG